MTKPEKRNPYFPEELVMANERLKDLIGRTCRTTRDITTRGGQFVPKGTVLRIYQTWRGRFHLESAERERGPGWSRATVDLRHVHRNEFELITEEQPC